jgi:hypothetical protein
MHLNLAYLNLNLRFQEIYLFIYGGSPLEVGNYLFSRPFTRGSFHLHRLVFMMDCTRFINEISATVASGEADTEETHQFEDWVRSLSESVRTLNRVMASTRRLGRPSGDF